MPASPRARLLFAAPLLALAAALTLAACDSGGGGDDDGPGGGGELVQLGPNLVAPNNGVTCQDGFPVQINATFPQPFIGQGAPSCLLLTFFPGAQPPTAGTVVSANIRVGAVTGPMRFVRMRILYQHGTDRACCSVEEYGDVFTPTPNGTTTVPLGFRMTVESVPPPGDFTIIANDLVGLEVLAPNVPIPGIWTAGGGADFTLPDYLWLPALSTRGLNAPTNNLRSEGSFSGFVPTYNLNFRAR